MYAVIVRSTLDDFEQATSSLREVVIPRLAQVPGFVSAQWVRLAEDSGMSMLTFETREGAHAFTETLRENPPVGVTINSFEVAEVIERV
jgi:hypothetical protein